jgi:MipA family protein
MSTRRAAVFILLALGSSHAFPQGIPLDLMDDPIAGPGQSVVEDDATGPAEPRRWRLALGGGIAVAPRFPGSEHYRTGLVPVVHAVYGPFFAGIGGVGVHAYRDSHWRVSAFASLAGGRKESDDERLRGLGDIDRTARAGIRVRYADGRFVTLGQVATDIAGQKQGTLARLDFLARFRPAERTVLFAGPGLTWADRQYTQSFFGVSAEQSARSGLPEFQAGAGLNSLRFSTGVIYRFESRWFAMAAFSASRLRGDAASSPITESRSQYLFFTSAAYVF